MRLLTEEIELKLFVWYEKASEQDKWCRREASYYWQFIDQKADHIL